MPDEVADRAMAEFIACEHPRLVGALTVHCGDRVLAEDLAQEALARVCLKWHDVAEMEAPSAWLYRVALNLASSWFRRQQAELRANRRFTGGMADIAEVDPAAVLAVREAVRVLPAKQRTALVCRYFLDMSVAETAQLMRSSENAVRQHSARGVRSLRSRFQSSDRR